MIKSDMMFLQFCNSNCSHEVGKCNILIHLADLSSGTISIKVSAGILKSIRHDPFDRGSS